MEIFFLPCSNIKKFLIFQETETLKKILIFSQVEAVLIFQETETLKKFLIFSQKKAVLFLGNRNPEKIPYISGGTSKAPKAKNF